MRIWFVPSPSYVYTVYVYIYNYIYTHEVELPEMMIQYIYICKIAMPVLRETTSDKSNRHGCYIYIYRVNLHVCYKLGIQ